MAIAALSIGATGEAPALRRARAMTVAVRFAIGHALLLALGAGALIVLGWSLPIVVERGGEMLGGILLIVFGAIGLWSVAANRVYGHTHLHGHEHAAHFHLHVGRRDHHPPPSAHSHLPTIVGAAFAVSSLRALTMLAPFGHRVEAASLADAARADRGVRGRDPAVDVALRRRLRAAHVGDRRAAARPRRRRGDGLRVDCAGRVLDRGSVRGLGVGSGQGVGIQSSNQDVELAD